MKLSCFAETLRPSIDWKQNNFFFIGIHFSVRGENKDNDESKVSSVWFD